MARSILLLAALLCVAAPATGQSGAPAAGARADHLAIHVANLDASLDFYERMFGLERLPTGPNLNVRWMRAGSFELHLIGGRTAPHGLPGEVHFALRVDNLNSLTERLDREKIAWGDFAGTERKAQSRFDGVRQIYLRDPDGYTIEVNELPKR